MGTSGKRRKPLLAGFFTIIQVAKYLDVTTQAIYAAVWRGTLPHVRIDGHWYIPRAAVEQRLRHGLDLFQLDYGRRYWEAIADMDAKARTILAQAPDGQ
jgi:excisionase family DNA binding protein